MLISNNDSAAETLLWRFALMLYYKSLRKTFLTIYWNAIIITKASGDAYLQPSLNQYTPGLICTVAY